MVKAHKPLLAVKGCQIVVGPDNSLGTIGCNYVGWHKGFDEATLDGSFTAAELRAIADHMKEYST